MFAIGAVAYGEITDDGFIAYEQSSDEGTTYVFPGEIVFQGEDTNPGFVSLCHYPDEFLMVSGGLLVEDGMRGYRVMGWDGQTHAIMGAGYDYTFLSAMPDYLGNPTDLALYTGRDLILNTPAAESNGSLRVILNGRPVLISFTEE